MANSSAVQLADLALVWSNTTLSADVTIIDGDLASDRGLMTAVLMSLFTDRRAQNDDVPPSGDPTDRRGWWADEFAAVLGDLTGSRLWLLDRSKLTNGTVQLATEYVKEALQWMLDDQVVESVTPTITTLSNGLVISVQLQEPNKKDPTTFKFAWVWDHVQEDL